MASLRQRNRLNAMRATQRTGLEMFMARGFDNVTVGEIANEVGMAASTIYRHFTTKEAIVLWDEHETAIDKAFETALKKHPPLRAIRTVFIDELSTLYNADLEFQLKRVRYIYATDALHAAAVEADLADRVELTAGLKHYMSKKNRDAAPVIAAAALGALDIAMDRWQSEKGRRSLADHIGETFDQLEALRELT